MSCVRLTLWTCDISRLPLENTLNIPEPELTIVHTSANMERVFGHHPTYLMRKQVHKYNVRLTSDERWISPHAPRQHRRRCPPSRGTVATMGI